ncbi:PepSY domain-containing protein [Prescottella subtropica]|uniref:PepSY domain-containing protein n=1 Tax=Prescottella subtropica TaxID=2545757 RepID=UPI0010F766A0|nr:PepSY domain-containing protein [Prescottella subtropica]
MRIPRGTLAARITTAAATGIALLALAACGSNDSGTSPTTTASTTTAAVTTSTTTSAPAKESAGTPAPTGSPSTSASASASAPEPAPSGDEGGLEAQISFDKATGIVLAEVPGGRITELKLEVEKGGTTVWEADVVATDGSVREVTVDAVNGRVLQNTPAR